MEDRQWQQLPFHGKMFHSPTRTHFLQQNLFFTSKHSSHTRTYFLMAKLTVHCTNFFPPLNIFFPPKRTFFIAKHTFSWQNFLFHTRIHILTAKFLFHGKKNSRSKTYSKHLFHLSSFYKISFLPRRF